MSFMPLEHFRRNDPDHIRKLNAVVDKLNALGPVSGAAGILVKRSPAEEQVASLDPTIFGKTWAVVEFGKPTAAYGTAATITLDPCDQDGTDNTLPNVIVHVASDAASSADQYSTTSVLRFVRYPTPTAGGVAGVLLGHPGVGLVEFGKPTAAYGTAATITLDPCDQDGTDNTLPNVIVHVASDAASSADQYSTTSVLRFVRYPTPTAGGVAGVLLGHPGVGLVEFGKSVGAFATGAIITLDPCTQDGVDNGFANIDVYLSADRSTVTLSFLANTLFGFVRLGTATAGGVNGIIVGLPPIITTTVMTNFQIDTGTYKFQKKTRLINIIEAAAESGWTDIHTGTVCP